MFPYLPSPPKLVFEDKKKNLGVFEIEGLYRGYGITLGNALRRVLLSSLEGAAITKVKIKNVAHEFSTIEGVMEDVIEIILNLKKLRFKMFSEGPETLKLKASGIKEVKGKDIEKNPNVEIVNPDQLIARLTSKKAKLEMEMTVEKGLGYVPVEQQKKGKVPIGTILVDALFSPIKKVSFEVEEMRVGERTDFNRLKLAIETDGTISPQEALKKASEILVEHFQILSGKELEKEAKTTKEKKAKKE
ncbi:MAG TPA: DNA-directed RNA polymerase subunit alpha [bacterium]|nr:DNA-directed RNA polymerase subunit alpha [bacterium]